ncbi:hypothetical protein HMPREF1550_02369 [Actinomyces sp. oral taxon 877 str. F0543]|nr:hypothetical protein HMPREF1550_02369 [Actinomyces sp. oral taxon 877 str. F0543]
MGPGFAHNRQVILPTMVVEYRKLSTSALPRRARRGGPRLRQQACG